MGFTITPNISGATERQRKLFQAIARKLEGKKYRTASGGGPMVATATFSRTFPGREDVDVTIVAHESLECGTTFLSVKRGCRLLFRAEHRFVRFPSKGQRGEHMKVSTDRPGYWERKVQAA